MSKKVGSDEKIKFVGRGELFDDCPICQAQKKALTERRDLTYKELMGAFVKAKRQGAVTGDSEDLCKGKP